MNKTISFFKFIIYFLNVLLFSCLYYQKEIILEKQIQPYPTLEEEIDFPRKDNVIKKIENTNKRKNIVTYYYAEELMRKKVRWKEKEDYQIILRGNAQIIHEKTHIYAPLIEIDPENNAIISGKLIVSEKEQGIYLYADGGEYNRKEEYIKIKNKPYMNLKNNQDTILITTNEIIRNIAEKNIIFKDYVKMFGKDWVLLADESIYYDDKKEFILKQNPVLLGKDLYLTAEDIIYKSDEKKIQIYKKPVMFTTIKESQNKELKNAQKDDTKNNKKNEQEKKEIMYITADLIEYNLSEKEPKGLIQGNVLMQSSTKSIYGDEFFLTGKGIEKIQTNKKVILIDKKENFYLESNFMEYDLKNKILILKNQPKIITYDDINKPEKKIRQELQASIIERDFNKEITIAKGNVFFKRDKEIAYSEYAIIDENKETLELTGSPILKRGDTEIHCKKIYVFKDKIEFERELEAKIY